MTIPQLLEEISEEICNKYCKYHDTCDENAECEPIRNGQGCPLDKLT